MIVDARRRVVAEGAEAWHLARWRSRKAFRLSDASSPREGIDPLGDVRRIHGAERSRQLGWFHALERADADALRRTAAEYEASGLLSMALEVLADEALMALRSANDSTRSEALRRRYEDLGCDPFLGPLPETRWAAATVST